MPVDVTIPQLGESITEAEIVRWLKTDGEVVAEDEPIAEIETDKATAELPAPAAGALEILVREGSTVKPGDVVARIQESKSKSEAKLSVAKPAARPVAAPTTKPQDAAAPSSPAASAAATAGKKPTTAPPRAPKADAPASAGGEAVRVSAPAAAPAPSSAKQPAAGSASHDGDAVLSPAARRLVEERDLDPSKIPASGRGGRLTKQDVLGYADTDRAGDAPAEEESAGAGDDAAAAPSARDGAREEKPARLSVVRPPAGRAGGAAEASEGETDDEQRVRMSRLRRSIAQRLVEAQHTAAILTTFNEIDMGRVMDLRARFKDQFAHAHGVSLGFMSLFARACVLALREVPVVNARIEGDEIVYSKHVHLGIAASTDRGLVVPVVRNADMLGLADLEREISRLADLARSGRIGLEDLSGGTFTISNGGVFGSLLSTPILNPPQSGILGMHKIEKRPVVVGDQIVARPMMYVALSYDHRLIDGREAVTFLVRVKEKIEDPERLLLEI